MENTKSANKVNKILFFIIALLLVIIFGLILYLFSNSRNELKDSQQSSEQTTPIYDEVKTLLTTDEEAVKLYESVSWPECSKQLEYYYQQDKILVKDMPHYLKQALAFLNVENSHFHYDGVDLIDVEQKYNQLFGIDKKFYFENIKEGSEICENEWICFNEINNKYSVMVGDSACVPSFSSKIIGIEKNVTRNEIYIYERVAFLEYINNDTERAKVYSDSERTKLVDDDGFISNYYGVYYNIIDDYNKELNTYKYTFRQNTDGNYNFISVEKLK